MSTIEKYWPFILALVAGSVAWGTLQQRVNDLDRHVQRIERTQEFYHGEP